ncbi:MAG: DUF1549 domain-containing protein, partial [Planctomycetaceae bacterium]|nr:DUF1549 domain-containing protein [Planctomycetaceae bacterium]
GDLLPSDSPTERDRYLIATGFLAMASKPAKAMNTNFDMDIVADQIEVIGTGIMGISVACARCRSQVRSHSNSRLLRACWHLHQH